MTASKVMLIRHGETDFNTGRRLQGALPVPLNDCGRAQSRALAQYLKTRSIGAIYTSPRARAKETALIIGEALRLHIHEDERLSEIAFGRFEGHTFAEVAVKYPTDYRKWQAGYREFRVPGGESRHDVQGRMRAAWDDITSADGADTVAVVGHSSALMILLASMFALLPDAPMTNTSITTLRRFEEIWEIKGFGQTPHLPPQIE